MKNSFKNRLAAKTAAVLVGAGVSATMSSSLIAAEVSGVVVDAHGGPIPNAKIEVRGEAHEAVSAEDGSFSLSGLPETVELHVSAPGYNHGYYKIDGGQAGVQVTLHRGVLEQVDVVGLPIHASSLESALPIAVLDYDAIREKQAATLGETLKYEIGVNSSYYGPTSSSPIIRGMDGPRVLITQNSLDTGDVSRVGPDHVVSTESLTAQQIEILRGPATLFYGSGAIGGVVNVVDHRVPRSSETAGAFQVDYGTVAEQSQVAGEWQGGTESLAFHVDGFYRDSGDYSVPSDAELEDDVLAGSSAEASGVNLGGSILLDNGFIGLSYGRLDRDYGVPGHVHGEEEHDHEEEEHEEEGHDEEEVRAELEQDRWQLLSELDVHWGWINAINTRLGYTDYVHRELHAEHEEHEDEHEEEEHEEEAHDELHVGTEFRRRNTQLRVDLTQRDLGGWRGALSIDLRQSEFEAEGEEAFAPPSETQSLGVAIIEEKHFGPVLFQLGARVEQVDISPESTTELELEDESFTPLNFSTGIVWDFYHGYNMGLAYSFAERAPSAGELFALGPHIGTRSYEIGAVYELHEEGEGDVHVEYAGEADIERSNNVDLSFRKIEGDLGFIVTAFYNQVDDYYYQEDTGFHSDELHLEDHDEHEEEEHSEEEEHAHEDALPVYQFVQRDANFYGLEAELHWAVTAPLTLSVWGDSVRAELADGGNLPRIPPARLGGIARFEQGGWMAELHATQYFEQDRVAENEAPTDGYMMLDAQVSYTWSNASVPLTFYLKGDNLTDELGYVHNSFLKDDAPLPGRGVTLGLRGEF